MRMMFAELFTQREKRRTFPALCTQVVTVVIVNPEVLLQHVLPCERFAARVTAVALHPCTTREEAALLAII